MNNIYIYPKIDFLDTDSANDYVYHLEMALKKKYVISNTHINKRGIIDLFAHLKKTDVYFLNWIEELPSNRFGKIQTIIFLIFLVLAKLLNKKIIWVIHNKYSHNKAGSRRWKIFLFGLMIKHSDLIITHSRRGIEFVNDKYPEYGPKVHYLIHPLKDIRKFPAVGTKVYDLFIWGTIYPYKGLIDFLKFVNNDENARKLNIKIVGICPDSDYRKKMMKLLTDRISYTDKFLKWEELNLMAQKSRFILFTYNSDSVLSSGSLMDSIRMGIPIIGPSIGAFNDLETYNFIYTYNRYSEIIDICNNKHINENILRKEMVTFCKENHWDHFNDKLAEISSGIL